MILGFIPTSGSFDILDWGSLTGWFANVNLPGGINWDTSQLMSDGILSVGAAATDPDGNGTVNGADLLLIQRNNPSVIPQWRLDYGGPPSVSGTSAGLTAVPELSSLLLLTSFSLALSLRRRHA